MMNLLRRTGHAFGLIFLVAILTGCAAPQIWMAESGRVLDWETKKPIEGAIVVAQWEGFINIWPVEAQSTCYHVESATTDAEGRFSLPTYAEGINRVQGKHILHSVYKAGYRESTYVRNQMTYLRRDKDKNYFYLENDDRDRAERLKYLSEYEYAIRCANAGESIKNLLSLYKSIYEEGQALAMTKRDRVIVDGFLSNIERIEIGYEASVRRAMERAKKRESRP